LGYGFQKLILEKIASGDELLSLDVTEKSQAVKLNDDSIKEIRSMPEVESVSPVVSQQVKLEMEGFNADANVNLVSNDYFKMEGIELGAGDFFNEKKNTIIVGPAVLQLLNLDEENYLGKKLTIFFENQKENANSSLIEKEYAIGGVIKGNRGSSIYAPIGSVKKEAGLSVYSKAKVKVASNEKVAQARENIISKGFYVSSVSTLVEQARQVFNVARIILILFGIVALIVSAIGMFNTMTIALLERTQEIGTMKALGASRGDIWKMFLTESMLIGFLGGTAGLLFGFLLSRTVNFAINMLASKFGGMEVSLFYTPIWFVAFIVIFSTVVGFITGLYPAKRAARLNALEALRYK
jgi:ABC-type lipoprotein release transport system permease subunit